jgi:PAS domain S-box-containing protein
MKDQKSLLQLQEENENLRLRLSETERELAFKSKALEESEKKSRHYIKFTPTAIYEIDFRSKKIVTANDAMVSLSGYSREELLSMKAIDILDKESILAFQSRLEKMAKGEIPPDQVEYKVKRKDGRIIYALLNVKFNLDDHGVPVGAVVVGHDITERKKAEEAVERERRQLLAIIESLDEAVGVWNTDGSLVLINDAVLRSFMAKLYGFEMKEQMLKHLSDYADVQVRTMDGCELPQEEWPPSRVLRGETFSNWELEQYIPSINKRFIGSNSGRPVRDANGKIVLGVTSVSDITERKRAEEALRESEERLRHIARIGRIGFVEYNIAKDTGYWSREHHEIYGYEPGSQISHEQWLQGVHPEDKGRVMANYARLLDRVRSEGHVEGHRDEYRFIRPDGDTVWIESDMSADIVRGEPIIRGSVRDITERKQAEAALDESREKLNMALENANVGLWEWNLKTNEFILDEKIEKMFGLAPGIFGNTYVEFEKLINEDDVPHFQKVIKMSMDNHSQMESIFRINPANGKTKYYSARALVNTDNEGRACGFTGVCFDITGMKESTDQLVLKLNEELLRSNKDLQQFAYVASHDLQEPLRMVTSFTQLLAKKYGDKLDKEAQEFINFTVDGAKRMHNLINDLLSYSRVQTRGKAFASLDMTVLLNRAIENLSVVIKETRAIITFDELPFISGDEGQITQLLQNLIGNALKFNNYIPEIHIGFKEDDLNYVFFVKDNGIGIEEQYFERIFIIFQRLVAKDEYPGTGIGLSICKSIVERHGGRIWVESEFGKGTTFYFTIPKHFN